MASHTTPLMGESDELSVDPPSRPAAHRGLRRSPVNMHAIVGTLVRRNTSSPSPRRRRRSVLTAVSPAALILVALLMATIAVAVGTAPPASAAEAPPLAPLLNTALLVGGTPAGTQSEGLFAATQAQRASLANLEAQAVDATVLDHALDVPGTSAADTAAAARTWGRDAAEIELWGLIVRAIKTPAASRTTDQANVVDWLQAVVARERATEIRDAALEYVKWAGLGASNYASLLASNP